MIRLPPSPTLFPYTTLFRSDRRSGQSRLEEQHDRRPVGPTGPRRSGPDYRGGGDLRVREEGRDAEGVSPKRHARDRKSTRLNSSHLGISYAVFCLKKKKKQQ